MITPRRGILQFGVEPGAELSVSVAGMNTNTSTPSSRATFLAPAFALCGALAMFAGCASEESHVVSAPPPVPVTQVTTTQTTQTVPMAMQTPTYVTTSPQGTTAYTTTTTSNPNTAVNTIIVTSAPPALQQEVVLARPSGDYVWVLGYWTWQESRYQWM